MAHQHTGDGAPDRRGGAPPRTTTGAWVSVGVLLGVGIVVPLMVFLYDTEDPTLLGFPFYYWFQFALIPVVSGLTYLAFRISETARRRDRQRFGLAPEPPDEQAHGRGAAR